MTGINLVFELGDNNGVDGVTFEISPIRMLLVFFITVLVIAGQVLNTDQLDMSGQFLVFSGAFSGKNELVIWFLLEKRVGIGGDVHVGLDRNHKINPIFIFDFPQGQPIQKASVDQQHLDDTLTQIGDPVAAVGG